MAPRAPSTEQTRWRASFKSSRIAGPRGFPSVISSPKAAAFPPLAAARNLAALLGRLRLLRRRLLFPYRWPRHKRRLLESHLAGNFGYRFSDRINFASRVRSNSSFAGTPGQTLRSLPPDPIRLRRSASSFPESHLEPSKPASHWSPPQFHATESRYPQTTLGFPRLQHFIATQPSSIAPASSRTPPTPSGKARPPPAINMKSKTPPPQSSASCHRRRNNQGGFLDVRWLPHLSPYPWRSEPARKPTPISARASCPALAPSSRCVTPRILGRYARPRLLRARHRGTHDSSNPSRRSLQPRQSPLRPQRSTTFNAGVDQYFASRSLSAISATFFTQSAFAT